MELLLLMRQRVLVTIPIQSVTLSDAVKALIKTQISYFSLPGTVGIRRGSSFVICTLLPASMNGSDVTTFTRSLRLVGTKIIRVELRDIFPTFMTPLKYDTHIAVYDGHRIKTELCDKIVVEFCGGVHQDELT
jgi:hypothetical protein